MPVATSMQVDESEHRSKRQKIMREADMELEDLAIEAECDPLQRFSDDSFVAQSYAKPRHLPRQNLFQGL